MIGVRDRRRGPAGACAGRARARDPGRAPRLRVGTEVARGVMRSPPPTWPTRSAGHGRAGSAIRARRRSSRSAAPGRSSAPARRRARNLDGRHPAARRQLFRLGPAGRRPRPQRGAHADHEALGDGLDAARGRWPRLFAALDARGTASARRTVREVQPTCATSARSTRSRCRHPPTRAVVSTPIRSRSPQTFLEEYERAFGSTMDEEVEIVCVRAIAATPLERQAIPRPAATAACPPPRPCAQRHSRSRSASASTSTSSTATSWLRGNRRRPGHPARGDRHHLRRRRVPRERPHRRFAPGLREEVRCDQPSRGVPGRHRPHQRPGRRRSDHHRGHPPRPELGRRPDEARAGPHRLLAGDLRGARLRGRALRPGGAPARPGAEPAAVHGHDELLRRGGGRGGRRRAGARAGRHHPLQLPLRHRLAPPGRGDRDAGVPARGRAGRLRRDQGPLARHRRQGALLDRHRRRVPGGHDLPGREAVLARRAGVATSTGWRSPTRACRRWSPATSTPRSSACAPAPPRSCGSSSATASRRSTSVERMFDHGEAIVARLLRAAPRRPLRRPRRDGQQRHHRGSRAVRGRGRDLGSGRAARLLERPTAAGGPDQLPDALDRLGQPDRDLDARGRRRPRPTRATSARSRSSPAPASMFHPLHPAPCFLYGWPAIQAIEAIYQAVAQALPAAVPACSGGDICALVWWGTREETGEPWADGSPHPVGQGASHPRRRRQQPDARLRGGDAILADRGLGSRRTHGCSSRSSSRADSCGPGRYRGGLGLDISFRMLEDA